MKNRITLILLGLVILVVLLMVADPGFQEKVKALIGHLGSWLGIDWGPIRKWRSAAIFYHLLRLPA